MRAYFTTPTGYIFMAIFLAAAGFLFSLSTLQVMSSDISTYFQFLMYGYIVLIPLLTMKSFAEEKRMKTEQLLLTAPVSLWGMVFAKFLAAFTMFFTTVAISSLYYLVLGLYGEPNWAKIIGCGVAMLLIGTCFIAVGLLVSSLTENQFVAAMCTMGVLLGLVVVAVINSIIDNYFVRTVLDWFSIYSRFGNFTNGVFDFASILYYVSIAAVCLFLTVRVYEKRRFA